MNKKLLAIAVGAAVLMPGLALADISIYGRAHVSLDHLDDGDDYSELNLSTNSSRLGFKGDTDVAGMTAFFQIEQEINFTQGGGADWAGRDTFAGLKGSAGMIRVGQFDTPFKAARGPANLFGDQLGDMRNITRVGNARFDERHPNTIHLQSPSFSGAQFNLGYSLHEGGAAGDDAELDDKGEAISVSVTYANGPLEAALAYETYSEDRSRGEREAVRLAGAYKVTDSLKLVAFYQTVDYSADYIAGSPSTPVSDAARDQLTSDVYGLGAEFKVTEKTSVRGMYLTRETDADDYDSDLIAVGVEHRLAKPFRIYANYAVMANDSNIGLTPWQQGRSVTRGGTAGEDASGLSLGARYDF